MGVDLVAHSATKYLGGHSDIVAGVVVGSAERMKKLTFEEGCLLGAVLDPFAAWLLLRGLRTLPIRMERHQQSARRIAHSLMEHPAVEKVFYPGLSTDPQLALTQKQTARYERPAEFHAERAGQGCRAPNGRRAQVLRYRVQLGWLREPGLADFRDQYGS